MKMLHSRMIAINTYIEILSLALVISYLIIHKIIFVFIGMSIALYSLVHIYIPKKSTVSLTRKGEDQQRKDSSLINSVKEDSDRTNNELYPKLSLVERVEIFGYIPSQHGKDKEEAA